MTDKFKEETYKIIRSKRKSLALTIDHEGKLVVRAPVHLDEKYILNFIREKEQWIARKQEEARVAAARHSKIRLVDGEKIPYLGKYYKVLRQAVQTLVIEGDYLLVPAHMTLAEFAGWLRDRSSTLIRKRVDCYAEIIDVKYKDVKISEAKRRWGSCGAADTLNFAWRLVMCPLSVIDYVVVHELCHIVYKDHGKKFWELVAELMPDYKRSQEWLRQNRALMDII